MKKKHLIWGMLTIMMVVAISFVIASCDKDNNKSGSGGGGINSIVVGTWKGYDGYGHLTLKFNSDGTGVSTYKEYDYYSGYTIETNDFTYTMEDNSNGIMIVKDYSYTYGTYHYETLEFEIEDNVMYVYEEDYGQQHLVCTLTKQ